jgi:S-adenosylmethionine decarboxylase
MSIHLIIEFIGVEESKISKLDAVRRILDRVVSKSGLKCVSSAFYQFNPHGVSGVYLLRESHLSIHTWPERGYAALDIFTCGSDEAALEAFRLLVEEFKPRAIKKKTIRRI